MQNGGNMTITKTIKISEKEFWETRGKAQTDAVNQLKEEGYKDISIIKMDFDNHYIIKGVK